MNIQAALKYRLYDSKKSIIIFYTVILCLLFLLFASTITIDTSTGSANGLETATAFFLFVFGLNSFKEAFRLFMQNGISRRTIYVSQLLTALIVCAGMSFIDNVILLVNKSILAVDKKLSYMGIFEFIYGKQSSDIATTLLSLLFCFSIYSAFLSLGYLITTLYYRMNKGQKVAVSIGVPVLLYVILPLLDLIIFKGALSSAFKELVMIAFGSPAKAILSSIILSVVFSCFSWLLIKRAVIKE